MTCFTFKSKSLQLFELKLKLRIATITENEYPLLKEEIKCNSEQKIKSLLTTENANKFDNPTKKKNTIKWNNHMI